MSYSFYVQCTRLNRYMRFRNIRFRCKKGKNIKIGPATFPVIVVNKGRLYV